MRNQLKTLLLLGSLGVALIAIGGALGPGWLYLATALALVLNVGAYFFSDRIVLRMHGATEVPREADPWLHDTVEELARNAGIPKPRVFRIADPHANAFATGRNPAHGVVAVTDGIVRLLDRRELRGVLAHEIAHIKNRDILLSTIAAVMAGAISSIASMLQWSLLLGTGGDEEEGNPLAMLPVILLAPLAATLLQLGVSRSREYLADETGAAIARDPEALASALAKLERGAELVPGHVQPATASLFIVNPLAGGRLARLFSTHPPMDDRIARLLRMRRAA